jgi:hypothetical protein
LNTEKQKATKSDVPFFTRMYGELRNAKNTVGELIQAVDRGDHVDQDGVHYEIPIFSEDVLKNNIEIEKQKKEIAIEEARTLLEKVLARKEAERLKVLSPYNFSNDQLLFEKTKYPMDIDMEKAYVEN